MHHVKTKFVTYVCLGLTTPFDTTPDANNDDGIVDIPTVTLDGDFTLEDIETILTKMKNRGY